MKCKKILTIVALTLSTVFVMNVESMATTAKVNVETLRLRKEASTDSTVLELLDIGEKLEVIEQSGDWVKVKARGITGYVHKDYIKIDEKTQDVEEPEKEEPENTEPADKEIENTEPENEESKNTETENTQVPETENTTNGMTEEIANEENNPAVEENNDDRNNQTEEFAIREETLKTATDAYILPLINSSKISNLPKDTKVIVMDEVKGWAYVQTAEINGWIRKETLNETATADNNTISDTNNGANETTDNTAEETPIKEKVMYVNSPSIYVRKGPSTKNEVVDSLILNAQVIVIGEVEDWYKVKVDGKTGYIAKRLLSTNKQDATSRGAEERETQNSEQVTTENSTNTQVSNATSKGEEIANYAKQYLGCKYVYGGSGPSTFDCSGFTMYVYKHFGISLSHSARAQSKNGTYVAKEDLQPGDLVFFKDYETMDGIGHCGIYIGDGNFIHASSGTGYCVKISTLLSGSYLKRYDTARRLI